MKFHAENVEYWSQNQVETVFFGNEKKETALLISSVPGTADHYLEWKDQANACINGVAAIRLSRETLQIQLLPAAAEQLGEPEFTIDFECDEETFEEISRILYLIFHEKLQFIKTAGKQKSSHKKDYSKIRYLNLEGKKLKKLPNDVAEMVALETAKLAYNPELDAHAIFEALANCSGLKHLSLTTEGAIPENLGKLKNLETLTLVGLTKPCAFPESIGQLKNLKSLLVMSDSDVILPESFADLSGLNDLNMRVAGWQLPSKFYQLSGLKLLDFTHCRLARVPEEMAAMHQVETVIFGSPETRDYAQILPVIARMPHLKVLEMNVNPVPKEISLCRNIENLIIWTGAGYEIPLQMPEELFELTQLQSLSLSVNYFEKIPEAIGQLKGLKSLVLQEAIFEFLPDSIGDLSNLELLNLSENPSLKSLPETLGKLTRLKDLYLNDIPQLTELPSGLENLVNLTSVRLSNRQMVKNVPEAWDKLLIEA